MEDVAPRAAPPSRAAWLAVAAYALVVVCLSSRPGGGPARWWFLRYDKVNHAIEYFILGALAVRALRASGLATGRACLAAIALTVAFGVSDEWHQSFVPGRSGNDLGDLAADAAGAGAGSAAFAAFALRRRSIA